MPLPSRVAVRAGSAVRGSSPSASACARSVSETSCPTAVSTLARRVSARSADSSSAPERVEHAVGAGQQPERRVLRERGQRQRRLPVVAGAGRGDGLEPRAERIGRDRLRRAGQARAAEPHAAPQALGAEARQPPAGVDVAAQAPRQRARHPAQRAGQQHALAVGRARVAGARERDVRGEVVARPARGRGRRAAAPSRSRTRAAALDRPRSRAATCTRPAGLERVRRARRGRRRPCRPRATRSPAATTEQLRALLGLDEEAARGRCSGRSGAAAGRRPRCRAARAAAASGPACRGRA